MILSNPGRPVRWPDRTLSVLRTSRLEACQKEMAGFGGVGLFDAEATDADAQRLYDESWYPEEDREPRLYTLEELQIRVLSQFPAEMALLSQEEFTLTLKLAIFGGEMPLMDWNDLLPARSLVRRMWCRARPEKGRWIYMPRQICVAALLLLSSEEVKKVREIVTSVMEMVDNTLYLAGRMPAGIVERDLGFQLQGSLAADKPALYRRLLKSALDTTVTRQGRLELLHPGLADPWTVADAGSRMEESGMNLQNLQGLYESLMEVEDPLYDRMLEEIGDLSRQGMSAEDTVEDLLLLAKQDAPVEGMREALAGRIICMPTEEMETTLREMYDRVPRWGTLNMERIQ